MNTFKRKSLYAALAGVSALGVTGAAQAVNLNPDGLGQVLIYPYYTTRADAGGNAYTSLLSVVNTTSSAKAVKVRFLEGKNSKEVLDFNLFLSKHDVWTAAIFASGAGAAVGTFDKSCTLPLSISQGTIAPFVNFAYTGNYDDKGGATLDRTKEGYVEIIEMATFTTASTTSQIVTHVGGVPGQNGFTCADLTTGQAQKDALIADFVSGGLFGGMTLINVDNGTDFTEDAVALDNYIIPSQQASGFGQIYNDPGSILPDLQLAGPAVSQVLANGSVYTSSWTFGTADPVSAVLMHANVMNEFVLDTTTKSGTDWVVTFPTKRYYVNVGTGNAPKLFQRNFNKTDGSCDDVSLSIYDREERTTSTPVDFSPPPPTQTNSICWEANVVTFNNSNVLASVNTANIPTTFQNGWLDINFPTGITGADPNVHNLVNTTNTLITTIGSSTSSGNTVTYVGLPVVGFAVQTFSNGTLSVGGVNVLSNYGGNFIHKYQTFVSED
ncbi:MAG TPA: hypothetical protein VGK37_15290 [Casimicrobiaceae bacterium]|jgi:hypothetical protein